MADSTLESLKAVVTRLKAHAGTAALVGTRVYSRVPQNATFPYIKVSLESDIFEADDFSGMSHTLRIQAFSRKFAPKECLDIRTQADDALDRQELLVSISGFNLVLLERSGVSTYFQEDDGETWQSIVEFKMDVM